MFHLVVPPHQPRVLSRHLEEDDIVPLDQDECHSAITDQASVLPVFVVDSAFSGQAIRREIIGSQTEPADVEGKDAGLF